MWKGGETFLQKSFPSLPQTPSLPFQRLSCLLNPCSQLSLEQILFRKGNLPHSFSPFLFQNMTKEPSPIRRKALLSSKIESGDSIKSNVLGGRGGRFGGGGGLEGEREPFSRRVPSPPPIFCSYFNNLPSASLTRAGLALPFILRMTCPTKKLMSLVLPPL